MTFTQEQLKLIYHAIRYYQMNKVALDGKAYRECDVILNNLFSTIHDVTVIKPSQDTLP